MTTKIPDTMETGHAVVIDVHIGTQAFREDLRKNLLGIGTLHNEPLQVIAPVMTVELYGDDFHIVPLFSDPRRSVSDEYLGDWQWDVTPTSDGKKTLALTVAAQVGTNPPVYSTVLRQEITVRVDRLAQIASFAGGNWQWLWGVLAPVIVGVLGRRWWQHRGTPTDDDADATSTDEDEVDLRGEEAAGVHRRRRSHPARRR